MVSTTFSSSRPVIRREEGGSSTATANQQVSRRPWHAQIRADTSDFSRSLLFLLRCCSGRPVDQLSELAKRSKARRMVPPRGRLALLLLLALSAALAPGRAAATGVFEVRRKFLRHDGSGQHLANLRAHDARRHGRSLSACKVEPGLAAGADGGAFGQGQMSVMPASRKKRVEGMPSKNLMAERRRRKRLNDRLSMLRSIVPKISKMDRTSILGDTINYMKELLERIRRLQEEMDGPEAAAAAPPLLSVFREVNPNEMLARNTPKFEVERKEGEEGDTRVEIYCVAKPGLLLSMVSTLNTLGLDIQKCVVSCFNDFTMHASCSEMQREMMSADAIKQELFKNAGYGGGCL